jgi:hypothetical protein
MAAAIPTDRARDLSLRNSKRHRDFCLNHPTSSAIRSTFGILTSVFIAGCGALFGTDFAEEKGAPAVETSPTTGEPANGDIDESPDASAGRPRPNASSSSEPNGKDASTAPPTDGASTTTTSDASTPPPTPDASTGGPKWSCSVSTGGEGYETDDACAAAIAYAKESAALGNSDEEFGNVNGQSCNVVGATDQRTANACTPYAAGTYGIDEYLWTCKK